ncbi:MAG: cytochrome c [Bacteroidales bacterium]|nr:cytochrome c [Bacteroidales bacterium]
MNTILKFAVIAVFIFWNTNVSNAQTDWGISEEQKSETLKIPFDQANQEAGEAIFNTQCKMCHNEMSVVPVNTRLLPLSPNLGSQEIQKKNSDGELFYKITLGHAATGMPPFDRLSEDDRWKLVTYIRTFYPDYQPSTSTVAASPATEKFVGTIKGITLDFDTTNGTIKAKLQALDEMGNPANAKNVKVSFYVKRAFGDFLINTKKTDGQSIALEQYPLDLPADTNGYITVIATVDGTSITTSKEVKFGEKIHYKNPLDEPSLWGPRDNAPLWLKLTYILVVLGVWITIGWAAFQIFRIYNLRER